MVRMNSRITAVILSLVASAVIAFFVTVLVSFLLAKAGIVGIIYMLSMMVVMPVTFALAAWFFARRFVMTQSEH
jgi:hypothetical protein